MEMTCLGYTPSSSLAPSGLLSTPPCLKAGLGWWNPHLSEHWSLAREQTAEEGPTDRFLQVPLGSHLEMKMFWTLKPFPPRARQNLIKASVFLNLDIKGCLIFVMRLCNKKSYTALHVGVCGANVSPS